MTAARCTMTFSISKNSHPNKMSTALLQNIQGMMFSRNLESVRRLLSHSLHKIDLTNKWNESQQNPVLIFHTVPLRGKSWSIASLQAITVERTRREVHCFSVHGAREVYYIWMFSANKCTENKMASLFKSSRENYDYYSSVRPQSTKITKPKKNMKLERDGFFHFYKVSVCFSNGKSYGCEIIAYNSQSSSLQKACGLYTTPCQVDHLMGLRGEAYRRLQ